MESKAETAKEKPQPRIFISYKRDVAPDELVAKLLFEELKAQNCQVFIDTEMVVGTDWAKRIEEELRRTDFLLVLLSPHSVNSEMVKGEISTAYHLGLASAKENNGDIRPMILPVRLQYREPFSYPLSAYLDPLNWTFWDSDDDSPRLMKDLFKAIKGNRSQKKDWGVTEDKEKEDLLEGQETGLREPSPDAQPVVGKSVPLGAAPGGPLDPESQFYVMRDCDYSAQDAIESEGATIAIKGPEQIGKSSLLFKTLSDIEEDGNEIAFIDFQLFDEATKINKDKFYPAFCSRIGKELGADEKKVAEIWEADGERENTSFTTSYIEYILEFIGNKTLVLALDQVEELRDYDYRSEFFKMLRSWHERRGYPKTRKKWKRLNLILVTSTEPHHLISDKKNSPFNVAEEIEPKDFSPEQVKSLNKLYSFPFTFEQIEKLNKLLCGHPYLVRKALWLVAKKRYTADTLFTNATDEYDGPFSDHFRSHLFNLRDEEDLLPELRHLIKTEKPLNEKIFRKLRRVGVLTGQFETGKFRCPLYKNYFERYLNVGSE